MDAAVNCEDIVTSEDRLELIVVRDEARDPIKEPICKRMVNEKYEIWYYDRRDMPPLSMEQYGYSAIPNCYGLLDSTSLEVSGILRHQNQPTLSLKGQGVFVAVIDTGIQYTDAAFRTPDGRTRIHAIWDQEAKGNSDEVQYGAVYKREEINQALQSDVPLAIVPQPP